MLRPHARRVATVCARHVVAPAACACRATTACATAALACVAVLRARSVCAAPVSGPTCLVATTARRRHPRTRTRLDAAIRALVHARFADAQTVPALHAYILLPSTLRDPALREDRDCVALLPTCEIADLPCAYTRGALLRPACGCGALVQAFAHVQLLGAPSALASCAQNTLRAMLLRCNVQPCPVCVCAARASALRWGALCLCRLSHLDPSRHISLSSTRRVAILVNYLHATTMHWPRRDRSKSTAPCACTVLDAPC